MRLTVGPLPAAVYWRRRAVVLVGLIVVALIIFYSCGEALSSNAGAQPSVTPSAGTTPSTTTTLLRPTTPTPTPTPTPTAFTLPTATAIASGPCTDAEISVSVKAVPAQVYSGSTVDFTITLTNTSTRTCSRDVGADVQELRLLDGKSIIWSSDDCNANTGHDVRSFGPGKAVSFTRTWDGRRSRTGTDTKICTNAPEPDPKEYQLVGRLDQKLSDPFALRIRA